MKRANFYFAIKLILLVTLVDCQNRKQPAEYTPTSIIVCGTTATDKAWFTSGKKAVLFEGLGKVHFAITTKNKEVQRYFDQGLMLAIGFNHAEAARSFFEATRLDSTCAMAYWGLSYVLGPNYNAGMEPDNYERAFENSREAIRLSSKSSTKEKLLIDALAKRYPPKPVENRMSFDQDYSNALKKVYEQFPDDAEIGALYVESLMDLHPWDLYEKDGKPKLWTPQIVTILEKLIKNNPSHIALHHFYIHAVEASKNPERGLESSAVLEKAAPNSSHLIHMPSHIYIRTGLYHEGSVSNQRAVIVDSTYLAGTFAQGAFPLVYFPHNYHFLAATATLEGNFKSAMQAAEKMAEFTRKDLMRSADWATLQHYYTIPYHVAIKFEKWDYILGRADKDTVSLKYPRAIRHYAKGLALVGKNRISDAVTELSQLKYLSKDPAIQKLTIWNINTLSSILEIACLVLEADILGKKGQLAASEQLLRQAVLLEDALNYNEPPDWFFSVRHYLGSALLRNNKYKEAELVYKKDLEIFPLNGWALNGLQIAQLKQGMATEAGETRKWLVKAWKWADQSPSP